MHFMTQCKQQFNFQSKQPNYTIIASSRRNLPKTQTFTILPSTAGIHQKYTSQNNPQPQHPPIACIQTPAFKKLIQKTRIYRKQRIYSKGVLFTKISLLDYHSNGVQRKECPSSLPSVILKSYNYLLLKDITQFSNLSDLLTLIFVSFTICHLCANPFHTEQV